MARKEKKVRTKGRLARNAKETQLTDYFLFNNAVLIQGYAMAPLIGGAINLRSATILALGGLLLIIPIGVLGEVLTGVVNRHLRLGICVFMTSLLIIPEMVVFYRVFGGDAIIIGLYLPLLFVERIITFRATDEVREGFWRSISRSLRLAVGYALVMMLCGTVREVLSTGTLWGTSLSIKPLMPAASTAPVGIIIVALFAALWNLICTFFRRMLFTEEDLND
ncbi:MAG: hypothetical protein IKG47_10580 [Oscillospiraceae bacterium]|nr:hypothetical protein [Oscillospiraceae bacterium]